jgi:hypothetical protein
VVALLEVELRVHVDRVELGAGGQRRAGEDVVEDLAVAVEDVAVALVRRQRRDQAGVAVVRERPHGG